jgi:hypothetical protein
MVAEAREEDPTRDAAWRGCGRHGRLLTGGRRDAGRPAEGVGVLAPLSADHRSPTPEQFVGDSPLEGEGFELSVPGQRISVDGVIRWVATTTRRPGTA